MILHDYFRSSAAYRVRIALNVKGVAYESRQVMLLEGQQRSPEHLAVNPQGLVPALEVDGRINRNSGAESTIHGLLTMLALDAHPSVRARATATTDLVSRDGLRLVEAEAALSTTGSVVTPAGVGSPSAGPRMHGTSRWSTGAVGVPSAAWKTPRRTS